MLERNTAAEVAEALGRFIDQGYRWTEADPQWPSACVASGATGMVQWERVAQQDPWDVSDIEAALGAPLHPSIRAWFGRWWSGTIEAARHGEAFCFPGMWNSMERDRITASLVIEATAKAAEGLPPTLFVANTNCDLMWVVDNRDGSVWLEFVGHGPHRRVAESLAEIIRG